MKKNKIIIADSPATYTNNTQLDMRSVAFLKNVFLTNGGIIPNINSNDKEPGLDGDIKLLNQNGVNIQTFNVQVKTLNQSSINSKVSYCFHDEGKFFKLVQDNLELPILLIGVDLEGERAYRKYLTSETLGNSNRIYFDLQNIIQLGDNSYYESRNGLIIERQHFLLRKLKEKWFSAHSHATNISLSISVSLKFERFYDFIVFVNNYCKYSKDIKHQFLQEIIIY